MHVAVLIPCFNEEKTIEKVIADFRRELPGAVIYVGDNACTDNTARLAVAAGATVIAEQRRGKGHMVHQMLKGVDADVYVMVDGDDTYRAEDASSLLDPVLSGKCDMSIGNRMSNYHSGSFGRFHLFGNRLIRLLTYRLHRVDIPDMLSGYRAFSRRTARELNLIMGGFEIETEINIKCVRNGSRLLSVDVGYGIRPVGSTSKIQTIQDGYRILLTIFMLLREHQPMTLGGIIFLGANLLALIAVVVGIGRGNPWLFGLGLLASLTGSIALACGITLHAVNITHRETEEQIRSARDHLLQQTPGTNTGPESENR